MVIILTGLELTQAGIVHFLNNHGFSAADAEDLGLYLNIPRGIMRTLKKDNVGNSNALFHDVIGSWLDITDPTSAKLAEALDNCGLKIIAKKIRSKLLSILL